MTSLDELRAAHCALSPLDWKFRELARRDQQCLSRASFELLDRPHRFLSYPLQSWPTFVDRDRIRDLDRISVGISDLIREVPRRIFDDDPVRICEFYGLEDPALTEMLLAPPNGVEAALSRGDLIHTPAGMKCIEWNFSSRLAGWESSLLAGMQLGIAPISRFIDQEEVEVSTVNTVAALFDHALATVRAAGAGGEGEANTAFVVSAGDLGSGDPAYGNYLVDEYARACRAHGLAGEVFTCHPRELRARNGKVFHGDRRVHALIELNIEPMGLDVYRSFKAGNLCLFNGPITRVLTSKANLALLSEHADSGLFAAPERELIHRHIPWTRQVRRGYVSFQEEREYLPELLLARREQLVLKPAMEQGGKGVALGRSTPPQQWERLTEQALQQGGWIAQEELESLSYLYQCGEYGCSPHDVIWGPFVFGRRYAGVILRVQPKSEQRAVNLTLTATEGVVFEVEPCR